MVEPARIVARSFGVYVYVVKDTTPETRETSSHLRFPFAKHTLLKSASTGARPPRNFRFAPKDAKRPDSHIKEDLLSAVVIRSSLAVLRKQFAKLGRNARANAAKNGGPFGELLLGGTSQLSDFRGKVRE